MVPMVVSLAVYVVLSRVQYQELKLREVLKVQQLELNHDSLQHCLTMSRPQAVLHADHGSDFRKPTQQVWQLQLDHQRLGL